MFKFLKEKLKNAVSAIKNSITKNKEEEVEKEVKEVEIKIEKGEFKAEEKKGFIQKIRERLTTFKLNEAEFEKVFWELERVLLENNVAMATIEKIHDNLQEKLIGKSIKKGELEKAIKESLKETLEQILINPFNLIEKIKHGEKPFVIVFFGINGSGKTTTIAKVVHFLQKHNIDCVLAASDTFRAASIEQLEEHAKKLKVEVIKHKYGSDPAAVAFDAIAHAKARKIKVVLIDTAGRMHSNIDLMQEMKKICKVSNPNLKLFVGEAIIGNDAVNQAQEFNDKVGIDAIILTKADVDEKGGASISISHITGKPILFLGIGQKYDDIEVFDKKKIIKSLDL
ncbi:MAG: signal recognition particle-docking protein FtsY [Nanoarchaeota archaeon]|nr:signal recognition particle-docking protein FtsY [Nanoarchaeota archaeon]